jgi:thiol-disulfide isomerase/thioredoxin
MSLFHCRNQSSFKTSYLLSIYFSVYHCPQCNDTTTTFPRYNSVHKLLETKQGRCGEYANLFGLVCRAAGFETRYVLDVTDHVWTEVRVEDHWVMADGCEGVIDKPSMYQHGWGKQGLSYMVAIGIDHMVDVTPRYTRPYGSDELQSLRRAHTSSEQASQMILKQINTKLQQGMPKSRVQELERRMKLEEMELQHSKQATEWTPQETHDGRGRMSGSLAWTQSRGEAGQKNGHDEKQKEAVSGFQIESFASRKKDKVTITVRPHPTSRHEGICISGTACAVGELKSISVVVLDEEIVGCILQSRSFHNYQDLQAFINTLPKHRIVTMNGMCSSDDDTGSKSLSSRLGGWKDIPKDSQGFVYVGQVDAQPDWVYCATYEECHGGYEVELAMPSSPELRLRTERQVIPQHVAGRLPESTMPLSTQLLATEEQKRIAFTSFSASNKRYSGYVTKAGAPVYLLDGKAYPLQRIEQADPKESWNTFHFLPSPLVPEDDHGIVETAKGAPMYDVPLEIDFFTSMLGSQLLVGNNTLPTSQALQNARLVGLYFSAHWCGPCRQFTPMLAEMYEHLKEEYPSHGLEIVFVSSDRDQSSFQQYYGSMPWQAIPFQNLQMFKQQLSMT